MADLNHTLAELLYRNPFYAKALHWLGVRFEEATESTLAQVCHRHRLEPASVVKLMQQASQPHRPKLQELNQLSIEVVLQYLRHSHHEFIKQRLPWLRHLMAQLKPEVFPDAVLARDLKIVFPHFAEDFIVHIYHEEDQLFSYIDYLLGATRHIGNPAELYYRLEHSDLKAFGLAHEDHDDEMDGIRALTAGYVLPEDAVLSARIIYAELQAFEAELRAHASIENHVLFPKAMRLEQEVRWRLSRLVKLC